MRTSSIQFASILLFLMSSIVSYGTDIGGIATSDTTFTAAGSPYNLTSNFTIPSGYTLTIEPGAVVHFNTQYNSLIIQGVLIADGTVSLPITFYSTASVGGGSIVLSAGSSGNSMNYCVIDSLGKAGTSAYDTGLYIDNDVPLQMDNCTFGYCGSSGEIDIRAGAMSISGFGVNNEFDNLQFFNNSITGNTTWPRASLSGGIYKFVADQVIPIGATLDISPGVIIDLSSQYSNFRCLGTLNAVGTVSDSVSFTSSNAGANGGSVTIESGSIGSVLNYVSFSDMGTAGTSAYDCGLYLGDAELTINHCSYSNCGPNGEIHIKAHAASIYDFGPDNSVEVIQLLNNTLTRTTTWPNIDSDGFLYRLTADQVIAATDTLTIEPGVVIDLSEQYNDLRTLGTLNAIGNAVDSIWFMSTNLVNKGGSVTCESGSTDNILEYVSFLDMGTDGSSGYDCGLYLGDAEISLNHCSFNNCGTNGEISVKAHAASISDFGPDNSVDVIQLLNNTLTRTTTWPDIDSDGFLYRLTADQVIAATDTLTIEPGVVIDLSEQYNDLRTLGTLIAIGNAIDSIWFMSTNPVNKGGSVTCESGSTNNILEYVSFLDMGTAGSSGYDCGLYLGDAEISLNHCSFNNCGPNGEIHVKAHAASIGDFGPDNSVEVIQFWNNSINRTAVWPNVDPDGFNYKIIGDQFVAPTDTLTIEPGVAIDHFLQYNDLIVDGVLYEIGTSVDKISHYSSDTISGGGSLVLRDDSYAELNEVTFTDLGKVGSSNYDCGLRIDFASLQADNMSFSNCGTGGLVSIRARAHTVDGIGPDNEIDDVYLISGDIARGTTWPDLDSNGFRYVIEGDINVASTDTLIIEPGVDIYMSAQYNDLVVHGTLKAIGTATDSISFKGAPAIGGGSIVLSSSSLGNELKYLSLYGLGSVGSSNNDSGIRTSSADVLIEKSTIRNSRYGIYVYEGQPTIQFNIIEDNSLLGLFNRTANDTVTACNNYWGDASGPFNAILNPTGLANGISDNVIAVGCEKDALEIICPTDIAFDVGDDYSSAVAGMVEVCIDDCESRTISFADDDPDPQCTQDMIRTWTVADTCGNMKTCEQTVSFIDKIKPTIDCPPNQSLACNEALPAVDLGQVLAMDNCAVASVILANQQETVVGCIHTYTRRYRATDTSGNFKQCPQTFTVKEDLVAPVLSGVPADITVLCTEFPTPAPVTASDNCDGSLPVTFDEVLVEGECGILLTRTWSAMDECGNEVSYTQNITGDRGTISFIGLPADVTIECSDVIPSVPSVTAEDNCGAVSVSFSENSNYDCSGTITRTWLATDVCGDMSSHTQTITIIDSTAPIFSAYPTDLTVDCPDDVPAAPAVSATDNCAVGLVVDFTESQAGLDVIRSWDAIDDCGNPVSHTQYITVLDDCILDCTVFDTAPVDLNKSFDPVNGLQDRVQVKWYKDTLEVKYTDEDAAACDIKFWPKRNLIPGTTTPTGPVIIAAPTDTVNIVNAKKFQVDGVTPREIFKWPVKFRADGANNNKRAEPSIRYQWVVRCACEHGAGQESPWSTVKIFNTPDFDPVTGIYTPPPAISSEEENQSKIGSAILETVVYPNPSTGLVNISVLEDSFSYEVMDLEGRILFTDMAQASIARLDMSDFAEGIYILKVSSKEKMRIQQIVISR